MIYLVKTTDREVKLFTSKPTKVKHHYLVDSGEEEQDYHGYFYKVQVPSKEYFECWEDTKDVKCPNCKSFLRVSLNDYYSKDVLIIDDKGHATLKHINTFIFCPCCCKEFIA